MRYCLTLGAAMLAAGCNGAATAGNDQAAGNGAAPSAAASSPDDIAMNAIGEFDRVCRDLSDIDQLRESVPAAGWQEYEPEANSDVARLLAFANTTVKEAVPDAEFANWSYRKSAGGRDLVLVLTDLSGPGESTECRVYDFAAATPPIQEALRRWTQASPTNTVSQQGMTAFQWSPGFRDNLTQLSVLHLDANSPLRQRIPGVGLAVTAVLSNIPAQ